MEQVRECLELLADILEAETDDQAKQAIDRIRSFLAGRSPLALLDPDHVAETGTLPFSEFMRAWLVHTHRSYGWLTDYLHATHNTPDVRPRSTTQVRLWQLSGRVPAAVVHEISRLKVRDRPRGQPQPAAWTVEEKAFLLRHHLADLRTSNKELAALCSAEFGRMVNEAMIKSQLDRLRKAGRAPAKRRLGLDGDGT